MALETSCYHWDEFQTHAFYVAPSIGLTVSVMNLQGSLQKSKPVYQAW